MIWRMEAANSIGTIKVTNDLSLQDNSSELFLPSTASAKLAHTKMCIIVKLGKPRVFSKCSLKLALNIKPLYPKNASQNFPRRPKLGTLNTIQAKLTKTKVISHASVVGTGLLQARNHSLCIARAIPCMAPHKR